MDFEKRVQNYMTQDPVNKVNEDTPSCFYEPAFLLNSTQQQHSPYFWSHENMKKELVDCFKSDKDNGMCV